MTRQPKSQYATSFWDACSAPRPRLPRSRPDIKALSSVLAVAAILALPFIATTSKPAFSQSVQLVKVDVAVVGTAYRAGKLIGTSVTNDKNESVGKIDDIIIDKNRVMYAVLQVGGFLGVGSRLVVVPFDSLKIDETSKKVVLPGASTDALKALAEFKYIG